MTKHIVATWLILASIAAVAYSKDGAATVTCGHLQRFEDRIGTINTPHLPLGAVIGLNTGTKAVATLGVLSPAPGDVIVTPRVASEEEAFSSDLSIGFSPNIPAAVQGEFTNEVKQRSHIAASNVRRTTMNDVTALVNASASVKAVIKSALQSPDKVAPCDRRSRDHGRRLDQARRDWRGGLNP